MEQLIRLLSSLPFLVLRSDFIVCGSGPMAIRGMRDVHDLDLLVSPRLWDRLAAGDFSAFVPSTTYDRTIQRAPGIDVFLSTPRMDEAFWEVFPYVQRFQVPGAGLIMFQPLRGVLAIKALCPSQPKHLADMISLSQRIAMEESAKISDVFEGDEREAGCEAEDGTRVPLPTCR